MLVRPLVCVLAGAVVAAQTPSPWAELHVPGGIAATALSSQGKVVAFRDAGVLHAWSAITRTFTTTPISGSATLRLANDCILVQDGSVWTAFAAYTGRFAPLPVSANATLVNAPGAVNDSLLVVADGSTLHVFSVFTGTWLARPISASWTAAVRRHVAVLSDGATLGGCDAYTLQWTDLANVLPVTSLSADGTAGFATGSGRVHAFSATRRTWSTAPLPPSPTLVRADDWGVFHAGNRALGYSAVRASFAALDVVLTATLSTQELFGLFDTAAGPRAFSAPTGEWSRVLAAPSNTFDTGTAVALLQDTFGTHGYSATNGRSSTRTGLDTNLGAANVLGWGSVVATGRPAFFSALTAEWTDAPANVTAVDPTLTTGTAASPMPGGCVAFVPRTGTFVPLLDPTVTLYGNGMSAPLLAAGATSLHAFDPRTEHWVSTPRAGTGPVQVTIWRTSLLVFDGSTAFAWGAQAGSWSSWPLPGPVMGLRANSESVRVHTANHVLAWSATGEVMPFPQFPEFRRVQPAEASLPLCVLVPPGGIGVLALGTPAAAPSSLPSLGLLWLDPGALGTIALVAPPSGAPVGVTLPPPGTALTNAELGLQAALLSTSGAAWLSDPAVVIPL